LGRVELEAVQEINRFFSRRTVACRKCGRKSLADVKECWS
jgi:hypothetical protein